MNILIEDLELRGKGDNTAYFTNFYTLEFTIDVTHYSQETRSYAYSDYQPDEVNQEIDWEIESLMLCDEDGEQIFNPEEIDKYQAFLMKEKDSEIEEHLLDEYYE